MNIMASFIKKCVKKIKNYCIECLKILLPITVIAALVIFGGEKSIFINWTLISLVLASVAGLYNLDDLRKIYLGWGSYEVKNFNSKKEIVTRRIFFEKLQIICFTCWGYLFLHTSELFSKNLNFEKNLVFKTWWLMLAFILSGLLANYILQRGIFARHIFGETKKSVVNGEYIRLERIRNRCGLSTQYCKLSEDVIVFSGDLISEKDDKFYRYKFINNTIYFKNKAHHIEWTTEGVFKFGKDYYVRYESVLKNGNLDNLRLSIDSYDNLLRYKKGLAFWIIVSLSLVFVNLIS